MIKSARNMLFTSAVALALAACASGSGNPMADAKSAFADNDYRAARIHLMTALKQNNQNPDANLLFGKTMLKLGDGLAAETAFKKLTGNKQYAGELGALMGHAMLLRGKPEKALELTEAGGNNPALICWVRARAFLDLEREPEALAEIAKGLQEVPNDPELLALRGNYEIYSRNISAATQTANLALKHGPDNLDVLLLNGQLAVMRQDLPRAKALYDKALKLYPDSVVPLFSVAAVNADLGNEKEAKANLKRVLELANGHPMALFLMAKLAFNDGDIEKAHKLMQETAGNLDDVPGAMLLTGEIAYLNKNYEQAIERLRKFLNQIPGHVQGTTVLAQALSAVGNNQEAYELVKPIAQRATATPQLLALASKLGRQENDPAAMQFDTRARVPKKRDDIGLKLTAADKAIGQKQWKKAEAIYADLRASGLSKNAIVLNNSALVQLELRQFDQAVQFARAAHALTPKDPHVMDTLGWTLLQAGRDRGEALDLLQQASSRAPGNLEIRWHYANALAANGQRGEAKRIISSLKAFAGTEQKAQIDQMLAQL